MTISPTSPCATSLPSSSTTFISTPLDRGADRTGLALAVGVVEGGHRRGLRQAVALEHLAAERLLEAAQHLDRQRRAAGHAQPQRETSYVVARPRVCSSAEYIVGTPSNTVTRSRCDDLQRLRRIEARDQRQARAGARSPGSARRSGRTRETAAARRGSTSPRRQRRTVALTTSALRRRLAWVSSAPFGVPVVPDV